MTKVLYFLLTFLESIPALFGIRSPFEEVRYRVVGTLAPDIEIRRYDPSVVVETTGTGDDGDAFSRLFRYISGGNVGDRTIAMTTPVEMHGSGGAKSLAQAKDGMTMRFFLPAALAKDPPKPKDPRVKIAEVPERTFAVLRFSGRLNEAAIKRELAKLEAALAQAGRTPDGAPVVFGYDPPFTIPFLRRNEVAIPLAG